MGKAKIAKAKLGNFKKNEVGEKWRERYEAEKLHHDICKNKLTKAVEEKEKAILAFETERKLRLSIEEHLTASESTIDLLRDELQSTMMIKDDALNNLNNTLAETAHLESEKNMATNEIEQLKKLQLLNSVKINQTSSESRAKIKSLENDVRKLRKDLWIEKGESMEKVKPMNQYSTLQSSYKQMKGVLRVVDFMKKGVQTTTDFNHLIRNIVRNSPFPDAMPFVLSPEKTFTLRSTIHLSDSDLKKMKKFFRTHLGFDVFASRNSIADMKKKVDKCDNYDISIVKKEKMHQNGRREVFDTVHVAIKDLHKGISERILVLDDNGILQDDEGVITLCLLGDKGSEETKLCISIENVQNPNSPHNLTLVGLYEGNDTENELRSNLLAIFQMWNDLKEVHYIKRDGSSVSKKVKKKVIGDLKILSAYLGHRGQAASYPCHLCEASWSTHGSQALMLANADFSSSFRLRTLDSYSQDSITGDHSVIKGSVAFCDVEPVDFAIPTIHSCMGLFDKYFQEHINGQLNLLDMKDMTSAVSLKQQKKELVSLQKEERIIKAQRETTENAKEEAYCAANAYSQVRRNPKTQKKKPETLCEGDVCIVNFLSKTGPSDDWIRCEKCQKLFHLSCASVFDSEKKITVRRQKRWECNQCLHLGFDFAADAINQYSTFNTILQDLVDKEKEVTEKKNRIGEHSLSFHWRE